MNMIIRRMRHEASQTKANWGFENRRLRLGAKIAGIRLAMFELGFGLFTIYGLGLGFGTMTEDSMGALDQDGADHAVTHAQPTQGGHPWFVTNTGFSAAPEAPCSLRVRNIQSPTAHWDPACIRDNVKLEEQADTTHENVRPDRVWPAPTSAQSRYHTKQSDQ